MSAPLNVDYFPKGSRPMNADLRRRTDDLTARLTQLRDSL